MSASAKYAVTGVIAIATIVMSRSTAHDRCGSVSAFASA